MYGGETCSTPQLHASSKSDTNVRWQHRPHMRAWNAMKTRLAGPPQPTHRDFSSLMPVMARLRRPICGGRDHLGKRATRDRQST